MTEVERIRREICLSEVAARHGVALKPAGREFTACCPFHAEATPSFTIFPGKDHVERFHCFGCGAHGDVIDFVRKIKGVDLAEALGMLGGSTARPHSAPARAPVFDPYADIVPLAPPSAPIECGRPVRLYNPKRRGERSEWGSFAPSMVFPYRRPDGGLIGYVLRHELGQGGKETPMVMWVRLADGRQTWCRFPFAKPRPLYGLDRLGEARAVLVVEGEKCRDALSAATGRTVVSWPGGAQGVKHADWSPLAGRNVVMWPDADRPHPETGVISGLKAADDIGAILTGLGCSYRVLGVVR
ncbi:CHC2 zinc finger domain-containing protein [Rhizobium sp. BR 249]|uniref:CHC2 zinc finger domain-containing protein n=1 Tax=Rhizobium sp. BR 249 TaxID=3040011 RepID=UPI0039BF2CC4